MTPDVAVILYVNSTAIHGGAEEALLHLVRAAAQLGHRPVLATPGDGWLPEAARASGAVTEFVSVLPEAMTTDSALAQWGPWLPSALAVARVARRHGAAIVHSNTPRTAYHGGLAARLSGARAITHCYDILGLPYASAPKAWLLDRLSDWTLTVSDAVASALVAHAPRLSGRMSTLYHGFDAARVAGSPAADLTALFGVPKDARVIVHASAMTPWKGQDVLVEAFRTVAAARADAHLVLVGGSQGSGRQDRFEETLRARVASAGLGKRVTFTGWREDWCAILAAAEIFVHAPTGPDPLPLVVLHAAALGRAIVAGRTGGIPEILGDPPAGLWVPTGDAPAMAASIEALLADPARGRALGARARERAGLFSIERMTTALAGVYDRLLHERR